MGPIRFKQMIDIRDGELIAISVERVRRPSGTIGYVRMKRGIIFSLKDSDLKYLVNIVDYNDTHRLLYGKKL